ncbi:DUF5695 domain-containing protein [Mucilaginibacter sp. CSA2-8R]|uniref:DUF5695 domain-containing protein n=1 Tax=Mucilaginibacter sp. CSA2-8R TaxID=3141542 RepID=UPI00315CDAA5
MLFLIKKSFLAGLLASGFAAPVYAQSWQAIEKKPSTLHLEQGIHQYQTKLFKLKLVNSSQTMAALSPLADTSFNYAPGDRLQQRDKDSLYHFGDIRLRVRTGNAVWKSYSTAYRRQPVKALPVSAHVLAAADLSPTLPADLPLNVKRYWETENGNLVLRFLITNNSSSDVEIGALGIPLIFNNILEGKKLEEAHRENVFADPYIGADAGYLEVNRLHGKGASLLVLPYQNTPLEAYNPLNDDLTPRGIAFEGFHEWMVNSKAYAENEWKRAEQWNNPTSTILKPGAAKSFAIKFVLAPSIRTVEAELTRQKRPVAVGLPGYVLPMNETGRLIINYFKAVKSISVYPANVLTVTKTAKTAGGYQDYIVKGNTWGRARVSIVYDDNTLQTISYKVIKSQDDAINDLGNFLTTKQWFDEPNDYFKRSPSVINYDYQMKRQLTQERRAWFAGLSDEAGSGSWLAAMMKQLLAPNRQEIEKLKRFANETLWGHLQVDSGPQKYGVKKSLFYYEPKLVPPGTYNDSIRYTGWTAWPKKEAANLERSYNYPHVAAAHWIMYRLGRYHKMNDIDWKTSLEKAYHTTVAMVNIAPYYVQFGQMEGSVFLFILKDLQREGMTAMAADLESKMKMRAQHWRTLQYPFGSEMPWDSTGQEEVYMWTNYFGYNDKADVTLNAILAYVPAVPHWGYNGSARRYWDFLFGGKLARVERQLHHYGSALNAIPLLTAYRKNPADFYLLRTGYAGSMGALSNITQDGFGPAAFHSYPSTLAIDAYASDYGPGFYGYAVNSATYIVKHPDFGWTAFGGNLTQNGAWVKTDITAAGQSRVFLADKKLWLTTASGRIKQVDYNPQTGEVKLNITGDTYLNIETPVGKTAKLAPQYKKGTDGYYFIPSAVKTNNTITLMVSGK